jgi:hypothetical protein
LCENHFARYVVAAAHRVVAVRLAGVGTFDIAHAGKPECYEYSPMTKCVPGAGLRVILAEG